MPSGPRLQRAVAASAQRGQSDGTGQRPLLGQSVRCALLRFAELRRASPRRRPGLRHQGVRMTSVRTELVQALTVLSCAVAVVRRAAGVEGGAPCR